jgi:DNA-binding GntR family transcriptional regulator
VFTLLEGLEVVASRAAAQQATDADVTTLRDLVAEMDHAIDAGSPQRWAEINTRFHLAICRTAGMPILLEMMQRAVDYWDRVRRYYFKDVLIHRTRQAQAEHHAIVEHLAARNLPELEQTVREHNQSALASYTTHLESTLERGEKRERHA